MIYKIYLYLYTQYSYLFSELLAVGITGDINQFTAANAVLFYIILRKA